MNLDIICILHPIPKIIKKTRFYFLSCILIKYNNIMFFNKKKYLKKKLKNYTRLWLAVFMDNQRLTCILSLLSKWSSFSSYILL